MSRKRRTKLTDEKLTDFFAPTERRRSPPPYDLKYARRTYRVTDSLHESLKRIAQREGVGLNDLVRYVFQTFIQQYDAGEIELPVRQYVVTRSRLTD
jgi:predicted HicB family RNase H-like nuclease